jgi:hypothetical protein
MHTKDKLAAALTEAGLDEMAAKAATGYYHTYLSPLDCPSGQLDDDLTAAGTPAALELRKRVDWGDFEASSEESDAWAITEEGQKEMREFYESYGKGE